MMKKLSLLLVLCMTLALLAGFNVYAAYYTPGTALDFDNASLTGLPSGVNVISDGYYGNVLNWDTRGATVTVDFSDVSREELTTGRHLLSFDVKQAEGNDKIALFLIDYDEESTSFVKKLCFEQRLGNFVLTPDNGNGYIPINGGKWTANEWTRYDILFDYDTDKVTLYKNGVQGGTISIAADNYVASEKESYAVESSVQIDGFNQIQIVGTTHDAGGDTDMCLDNFCYRPYPKAAYRSSMSVNGDELIIKFAETTPNLTVDNFSVTKKANPLSAEEDAGFAISESCGAYTVLKLSEEMKAGERYFVTLNNVQSTFGNSPATTRFEYFYDETVTESFNEDMSAYEKDALTDAAVDTMWTDRHWTTSSNDTQKANNYTMAADGVVTLIGGTDGGKLLRYNVKDIALDKGIIEIETTVGITHTLETTASTPVVYYNFQDVNGTYKIGEFRTDGFMAVVSTTADARSIDTKKDTTYQYDGGYNTIKSVIDLSKKTISTSVNEGEPIISNYVCGDSGTTYATDLTDVSIVSLNALANTGVVVKLENIKVTKTIYNTAVSDIYFTDVYGNTAGSDNVSSAANKISVKYPSGMLNNEFNGSVILNDGTTEITGTGSYDTETGIYTYTLDKLLGANKTYTMTLSGSVASDGSAYHSVSGTFTTGNGIKEIKIADVQKTDSGAVVTLNAVNTGESKGCYVITAGYKNDELAKCYLESISIDDTFTEYTKMFTYNDSVLTGCDYIKTFIWNDISQTLMPVED